MRRSADLESVEIQLADRAFAPFNASSEAFQRRFRLDKQRLEEISSIIEQCAPPGGSVLEIGASPYILTTSLANSGYRVTANQIPIGSHSVSDGLLKLKCHERWHTLRLVYFDAEDSFPLLPDEFDVIVAGEVVEHFYRRPWHFFAEAWRCLRSSGLLVFTTPNGHALERAHAWIRRRGTGHGFNPTAPSVRHAREYAPWEIADLARTQGFTVESLVTRNYAAELPRPSNLYGHFKRSIWTGLKRRAMGSGRVLGMRGDTIVAVLRKDSTRAPGQPPEWIVYGLGTAESGYNFE